MNTLPGLLRLLMPAVIAAGCQAQVPNDKDSPMSSPLSGSQPSAPVVTPIEHDGIRYEQDVERQRRLGAQRGGWLVAVDACTGVRLWAVQVHANPHDAGSPAGSPVRWFATMRLAADGKVVEITDTVGSRFEVDLDSRMARQVAGPSAASAPKPDHRPSFD